MNPLSPDSREMCGRIDQNIEKVMKALCVGNISNIAEDSAKTWYQRGQVHALNELRKLVNREE